ncbi:DegT/DnrJ/EryC1/StrS family aminotransferase [Jannaschia seohaensis]|uniref:dTDP-4-amino-4,6-dideoxygalactose transaminase n=1 Tax=Jannaschia seohaensis TaxID=475081 RepID=A0A2Y9AP65_9RHOB|nr:DegT/DnrJ/EryC1/StrS family aminotransferase [Jannaschia seohaensis]PWJ20213.1 dTDP-4-amino-4,6-dideoxygalactose transaminase [Jannaschia seohaensis]SSA44207.1 dTDP-4-amino-4,6-dideoxygalactose transaminase [Jannaschia seohaensis]
MLLVNRPLLPAAERLLPYHKHIDSARFYSNYGPLNDLLQQRLATHFGRRGDQLALANSGTSALYALLLAAAGPARAEKPVCVCPAFTFAATAAAAELCGYTPFLADIDAETWALDHERVMALGDLERVGAVITVAPFGRPPLFEAWQDFTRTTGIPLIIDAAASFDVLGEAAADHGDLPIAVSLHATKTFSTAEGGLMFCDDPAVVKRAVAALNFGFNDAREALGPGLNGKLSEYHCALGLAELDGWPDKRLGFLQVAGYYEASAEIAGLSDRIYVGREHANPYALFRAQSEDQAQEIVAALRRERIESRLWWGRGLHHQQHFRDCTAEPLPVTDDLAPRLLGLPFAVDLAPEDVERVIRTIDRVVQCK